MITHVHTNTFAFEKKEVWYNVFFCGWFYETMYFLWFHSIQLKILHIYAYITLMMKDTTNETAETDTLYAMRLWCACSNGFIWFFVCKSACKIAIMSNNFKIFGINECENEDMNINHSGRLNYMN